MTVSIERLHCGSLTCELAMMEDGAADEPVELSVPSWLIRHPDGLVLVDTGMNRDLAGPGEYSTPSRCSSGSGSTTGSSSAPPSRRAASTRPPSTW